MIGVIASLLEGDRNLPRQFAEAHKFWQDYFADKHDWTEDQFAKDLFMGAQYGYKRIFDEDYPMAKATMVMTALGTLYDDVNGWDTHGDLAVRVAKGFARSDTSVEVKASVEEAVFLYGLHHRDAELRRMVREQFRL